MDFIASNNPDKFDTEGQNTQLNFVQDSGNPMEDRYIVKNDFINKVARNTHLDVFFDLESYKILRDLSNELFKTQLFTESLINENDRKK
eukprot:GAHX01001399.1.p1 GENE.GAHX01001399.1~~GAHX01001399.1.p1  ORF type:complete len:89 (-),score=20.53 GAHX01001399.1:258-524(-)